MILAEGGRAVSVQPQHLGEGLDALRTPTLVARKGGRNLHDRTRVGRVVVPPSQQCHPRWRAQGALLTFEIEANAFLYRMVRSIVGTLTQVGWGQISVADFRAMLEARDHSLIRRVAPAQGLCLMQVNYAAREGVLQ